MNDYTYQIHELKTWPKYYSAVRDGTKTFEVRVNDRNYQAHDLLILREWSPEVQKYTGYVLTARVTYVLSDPEFVKPGYVVMGIKVLS